MKSRKGILITLLAALSIFGWLFFAGRIYIEPKTLKVVAIPGGTAVYINEEQNGKWFRVWPRLPVLRWGKAEESFALEKLDIEILLNLYTLDQWTGDKKDSGEGLTIVLSGKIKVSDWQKFLALTDPKKFNKKSINVEILKEFEGKELTRENLISLFATQKLVKESGIISLAPDFDSRVAFSVKISEVKGFKTAEETREFILKKRPWYWAFGPLRFQFLYNKVLKTSPELIFDFEQKIIKANYFDEYDNLIKPNMLEILEKQKEDLNMYFTLMSAPMGGDVAKKDYETGAALFNQFLKTLGDNYFIAIASMDIDTIDKATKNFLKNLPDKPSALANSVFISMTAKEWVETQIKVNQEIFDKELYPFFISLPQYKSQINNNLWLIAINASFIDLPKDEGSRGRVIEQVFYSWLLNDGKIILTSELPKLSRNNIWAIEDFKVKIERSAQ